MLYFVKKEKNVIFLVMYMTKFNVLKIKIKKKKKKKTGLPFCKMVSTLHPSPEPKVNSES